jgi:hypothetical protein
VVISTLVLLEVIDVIRKRVTEKEFYAGLGFAARRAIESKAQTKIQEFVNKTTRLAAQGKARIVDPDRGLADYHQETLRLSQPHFGMVDESNQCPVCRRALALRYKFRGLGHYDIQHAINARDCLANELFSFDKAFSQMSTVGGFASLAVHAL